MKLPFETPKRQIPILGWVQCRKEANVHDVEKSHLHAGLFAKNRSLHHNVECLRIVGMVVSNVRVGTLVLVLGGEAHTVRNPVLHFGARRPSLFPRQKLV